MAVDKVQLYDEAYTATIATCLFIATLTLFRPMVFSQTLARLKSVLRRAAKHLLDYALIVVILFLSFGLGLVLSLGAIAEDFTDLTQALKTEFVMTLIGYIDYEEGNPNDVILPRVLLFMFHLCSQIIYMNLFVSFLYTTMAYVKANTGISSRNKELSEHIVTKASRAIGSVQGEIKQRNKRVNSELSLRGPDNTLSYPEWTEWQNKTRRENKVILRSLHQDDVHLEEVDV